uniref:Protein-tyrosine-phosphatase n=1 Tax=Setaria digitata TaxID=48799 RepID=A0A915Q4B1_9BILA
MHDAQTENASLQHDRKEVKSKRERKKVKDGDEKFDKGGIFNTFTLRSKRERKHKKKEKANDGKSKQEQKKNVKKKAMEERSVRMRRKKPRDFPVTDEQKENYSNFLLEMFGLGVDGIIKQFQTYLKAYIPPNISHTAFDKNMKKNRYKDVVCIDDSRVLLQCGDSDYIHANHVKGDPFMNPFICTQGPLAITVNDFWFMIMQEKVSNIVMLCNVEEAGKKKCFQYWPREVGSSLTFGDVQVTCSEVDETNDTTYVMSTLEAENKKNRLVIKHMRWKDWPDKGVPSSVLAPFRILKIARQSLQRPTVIHCSAGIGRTGCIVAIEMGLQQILSGKPLSLIDMNFENRNTLLAICIELTNNFNSNIAMRMSAIQTDEQLVYVVRCLVAYAEACGLFSLKRELQEKAEKFSDEYNVMLAAKKITPAAVAVEQKMRPVGADGPVYQNVLAETKPVEEQAMRKAEERQEEPSQKSRQSIGLQVLETNEAAVRLDPSKTTQKQQQESKTSETDTKLQPKKENASVEQKLPDRKTEPLSVQPAQQLQNQTSVVQAAEWKSPQQQAQNIALPAKQPENSGQEIDQKSKQQSPLIGSVTPTNLQLKPGLPAVSPPQVLPATKLTGLKYQAKAKSGAEADPSAVFGFKKSKSNVAEKSGGKQ